MKKSGQIRVLVLSNMYPNRNSHFGIFVKDQVESLEKDGVDIVRIVKTRRSTFAYAPFILKSISYLLFGVYDLVHAHYGFHSALFAALVRRKPLVVTFHRGDALDEPWRSKFYYCAQKLVVKEAMRIIAVSQEVRHSLVKDLGSDMDKIATISCGVDSAVFRPIKDKHELRKVLNLPKDKPLVLFVGSLSYRKGVDIICKCAELLPNVNFVLVGDGNLRTDLPNCTFVGPKPHHELRLWMNACDVFLLPSRSEGLPVVILEACSCGLPVITAEVGGIPDMITNGENGFIVKSHNPEEYAQIVKNSLGDKQKLNLIGRNARELVRRNYDNRVVASKIKSIYESLV